MLTLNLPRAAAGPWLLELQSGHVPVRAVCWGLLSAPLLALGDRGGSDLDTSCPRGSWNIYLLR